MTFLGISSQLWQTILIIAFPFLYRSLPRLLTIWNRLRGKSTPLNPQLNPSNPTSSPPPFREYLRRLGWTRSLFLITSYITLILRSTLFNPSHSNPFSLTRLPLNTSSTTLASALSRYYRSRGFKDTPDSLQRVIQRLTSLDSRLLYSFLGPDSLLYCQWCRPPSKEGNHLNDHFAYTFTRIASQYAFALIAIGLMTTSASSLDAKRRVWRIRASSGLLFGLFFESIILSVCLRMPTLGMNGKSESRMIGEKIYTARHTLFAGLLSLVTWAVVTEIHESNTTALARLGIHIASVSQQLDTLVSRLRLAALQRSTVMRDPTYREQSTQFWKYAETQAKIASENRDVEAIKAHLGLSRSQPDQTSSNPSQQVSQEISKNRQELKDWIENAYPIPALAIAH